MNITAGNGLPGFNIIGHFSSSSGHGNTARSFARMLKQIGYGVAALDIDFDATSEQQKTDDISYVYSTSELPYAFNLIVISIQILPSLWRRRLPGLLDRRFKNAGLVFWELPTIPRAWLPSIRLFDAVMVCSPFQRHAMESSLPEMPTLYAEHPIAAVPSLGSPESVRARLGVPENAFTCCTSFDLRSDFSRKNPAASVAAFQRAFPLDPNVRLVIKTNGAQGVSDYSRAAKSLVESVRGDKRIILLTETLPYEEVLSIYNACDVFLSLHRAEGLGLAPLEAMLLGKLVVATGYSGNMAYMTEQNSMPVSYQLVEPSNAGWQFGRKFAGELARWANPDIDDATRALKVAHDIPQLRNKLARRGRRDILERQKTAWSGHYIPRLCRLLDESQNFILRHKLVRQVRVAEIADQTLRSLNIRALIRKAPLFVKSCG